MSTLWPYISCVSHSRQPESYNGHIYLSNCFKDAHGAVWSIFESAHQF